MLGVDPLQEKLEEMERCEPSPSSRIRRNPIRVLSDKLDFLYRRFLGSVERVPKYLAIARRWGETVYNAPKTVEGGETFYGSEVRHLVGVEIPAEITPWGRWSVFPSPWYGIDNFALEKGVRTPTHRLSLAHDGDYHKFVCRPI